MNSKQDEIDLREIFFLLKKRWMIILAVSIIFGIAGGLYSHYLIQPLYSSTSKIYVINKSDSVISTSDLTLSAGLTADYIELIKSRTVLEPVIEDLKLNTGYASLKGLISIVNPKDTHILSIQVIYTDPVMAKEIANKIVLVSKNCIQNIMPTNEVNVVEEATLNGQKISPNTKKNTLVAILAGVFLSCGIIIIRYLINNTVKTAEDVERYLGLNTLGIIPNDKELSKTKVHKDSKKSQKKKEERNYREEIERKEVS